jgi:hypothetical protein
MPSTTCTLQHVPRVPYTTCTRLPSTFPWFYPTRLRQNPSSQVTVYSTLVKSYYIWPPSITRRSHPTSFYNYICIRTHHASNQHVTVISPDHRHARISCCIVTVISPRNLLCALAEHTEATFSPPKCASIISPIV